MTPQAPWAPDQKMQFLQSNGYNADEAKAMLMGGNPMKLDTPLPKAQPFKPAAPTGQGMAQKGLSVSPDALERLRASGVPDDAIADQMAQSSPHFASQVQKIRKKFGGDPAATSAFLNTRFYGDTQYNPASQTAQSPGGKPKSQSLIGRTLDSIYTSVSGDMARVGQQYNEGEIGFGQVPVRMAPTVSGNMLAPLRAITTPIVQFGVEKTGLGNVIQDVAQSEIGQSIGAGISDVKQRYDALPQDSLWRDAAALGKVGLDVAEAMGAQALWKSAGGRVVDKAVFHPVQSAKGVAGAATHPIQTIKSARAALPAPGAKVTHAAARGTATTMEKGPQLIGKAKEAVDKNMDETLMRFVASQRPETRAAMAGMTRAAQKGSLQLGGSVAHKEALGGYVMNNVEHVLRTKEQVGKALGAMKASVADDVVDLTDDYLALTQRLNDMGAVTNGKGQLVKLMGASDDNLPLLRETLAFFQPDDAGRVFKTGREIDLWRSKMFQEMNSAKAKLASSSAGQSVYGPAERVVNDLRRSSFVRMAGDNRNMIAANDAFEQLSTETSKFLKAIGYKEKLDAASITAKELKAGEVSLRTLGNASADTRDAFESLLQTARRYGYQSNVDEMALVRYADALEDVFPITPTRSLAGQVSRATRDSTGKLIDDVADSGVMRGVTKRLFDSIVGQIDSMRGITPENRYRLLLEVLDSPPDTPFFQIVDDVLPESVEKALAPIPESITAKDMANPLLRSHPGFMKIPGAADDISAGSGTPRTPGSRGGTSLSGGSSYGGTLPQSGQSVNTPSVDDVPLSEMSPIGRTDAAAAQSVLSSGGSFDDSMRAAGKANAAMHNAREVPIDQILPPKDLPKDAFTRHAAKAPPPAAGFEDMPIEVVQEGEKFRLIDGAHRVEKAIREGRKTIMIRVPD